MPSVSLNENSLSVPPESQPQTGGPHYPPPPPHQQQPPPPTSGHHQYSGGYPPYPRTSYEHAPQHHLNNNDAMAVSQQHPYQHPYPPLQQPPMRFPGKPLPGGPSGAQQQQQPPPGSSQYPPQQMRSNYPPTGQSISQPTGPTPTLNQLLQPGGSAAASGANGPGVQGGTQPGMPAHGAHRYPPPGGYEHNSYNMPPHSKSDYPAGPAGWPPPPNQRPAVNSYGHPPPPFQQQQQQQQQQAMYRQNVPPPGGRSGPSGQASQHPGQYYQSAGMHHPPPPHQQGFPPPPPQSPHYTSSHSAQRYPGPGTGMRPGESQPPSHYPSGHTPGMSPETSGLAPSSSSGPENVHSSKSTPPPPQSPSLAQQQMNHAHNTNPPSPQQSPRSTPVQSQQHAPPPASTNSSTGLPPSSSPSHRPQGSSPSNNYPPPPDVGDMTGCNSNDSVGGTNASGVRPSPSPTGSASSRSMSPAVGSQNIPVPPRPSSSQSDGSGPSRMSQSPMPGSYPGQQSMAPPTHHGYPPGGKLSHPNTGIVTPGHPPPTPQHYTQQQGQQHWQHGQQQYGARPPHHMMNPYPPTPSQQTMPPNSYPPPRHPVPNHVGGPPPPQNQYSPYPLPQYGGPQLPSQQSSQPWASPSAPPQGTQQNPNTRSHPLYLKQHLQQKLGFSPPPHGQGYGPSGPMGPPQPSNMSSSSPSQTPPPSGQHGPPPHLLNQQAPSEPGDNSNSGAGANPPNIVSVGPDGANVDDVSQQSTLSNTSGASGGEDGPAMPKLRKESHVAHQNYPSHPATPQSNAVPSPGAASMGSTHEEYGEINSPGWPRTPASPGLNSHPPPPSEQYKTKAKKPDSLQKLYDMDENPDRRGFLDKLMQFMDEHNTPITACPTISKNPLDLFRLYFLVKERGGFLEVTKNKTWKDIAGSLGIGASSSAAYTLRKHYTKHLLPFECKFDRGGIDPQPLINQVESTSKKKGAKVAPVPSPGSSNSQDSFQGANNNSTSSLDGFNNMPPSTGGGPPTPYGVNPPSEYNQQGNSSTPTSNSNNPGSTTVNSSTPPLRQPSHAPIAVQPSSQPSPQGASTPPQPHSHSGYQGPPGVYQPYSSSGDQYGGREAYNQQGYGTPTGYPASGLNRPMYPYPDSSTPGAAAPAQAAYSTPGQSTHQGQPASQQPPASGPTPSSGTATDERYNMGPPVSASGTVNYPGHAPGVPSHQPRIPPYPPGTPGTPGTAPPNGYTNQDYYHSQPPPPNEQGYPSISGGQSSSTASSSKHMPPPQGNQNRRLDYPPGKEPAGPVSGSSGSQSYPNYPPQGQGQPIPPQQRMQSYDGQGTKGSYMYPTPSSSSNCGGATGGRDGTPSRSSPSPSPAVSTPSLLSAPHHASQPTSISLSQTPTPHNTLNKPIWTPSEGWTGSSGQYSPHHRPYASSPTNAGPSLSPHGTPAPGQPTSPSQTSPSATAPQSTPPPAWPPNSTPQSPPMSASGRVSVALAIPPTTSSTGPGQWPHGSPPPDHGTSSRYGTSSQGTPPPPVSPQTSSGSASGNASSLPWTPPNAQGRSGPARAPFPSIPGKNEMYKVYGPGSPVMQPSTAALGVVGQPPGGKGSNPIPANTVTTTPQPSVSPAQITYPCAPPPASSSTSLPLSGVPHPVATKKEIVFPPDSVEGVSPVFSRRKKLYKNDVAPVEAWRIMMCLKSGLLAETTWALDVLNVLLYDDHSISYFSLTYLPGLLDILLEHLRRALYLIFGNSIGIEMNAEKVGGVKENSQEKQSKWYERGESGEEEEPDLGTPRQKFPRDGHRTLVLHGTTNYTMVSRISRKTVGFVGKDNEPFVLPGPRDWDNEEKCQSDVHCLNEQDLVAQNPCGGLMELTKHVITSFTADLNIVPVVRLIQHESSSRSRSRLKRRRTNDVACHQLDQLTSQIKTEPQDCDFVQHEVHASDDSELNLDLYQCETKLPNEIENIPSLSTSDKSGVLAQSKRLSGGNSFYNNCTCSGGDDCAIGTSSSSVSKTEPVDDNSLCPNGDKEDDNTGENDVKGHDRKNCELHSVPSPPGSSFVTSTSSPFAPAMQQSSRKLRKLDQVLDRIKHEVTQNDDEDNEEGCLRRINGLPESDESSSLMDTDDISVMNGNAVGEDTNSEILPGLRPANSSKFSIVNCCDETSCEEYVSNGEGAAAAAGNCFNIGSILVVDHGSTLKRKKIEDFEDECYTRDEPSLYQVTETQDALARRCLSIFNILRNLTFVPGNDGEFGKSIPFLSLLGKLLLIYHEHPLKCKPVSKLTNVDSNGNETSGNDEEDVATMPKVMELDPFEQLNEQKEMEDKQEEQHDAGLTSPLASGTSVVDVDSDSCTSLNGDNEWWWEYVHHVREHVLVMISNISGQMDLSQFSEEISRPILDGLLHWATCPAAYGQDPFPTLGLKSSLSPQRLAIEALCKLSVTQGNMDLLLATPPYSRIERLCQLLCRSLCPTEDQVMREFAINLLSYLSAADSGVARTIALQNPCISLLISFIEQAEVNANNISINHGFQVLRDNPEAMGTSLDMLRRAATTLFNLARHPDNRALFVQHEPRLLSLVMSHILEQKVAAIVAQVLFQCSAPDNSSSKYILHSNCNYDSFYSIARSRSSGSRNKH